MSAFSSKQLRQSMYVYWKKELVRVASPRIRAFTKKISNVTDVNSLVKEAEELLLLSNTFSCPYKISYSMEEAAMKAGDDPNTTPYICRSCGFVHYGHESENMTKIKNIIFSI